MTTDLHDHDLGDRLRAVLSQQAETVTGPPPPLTGSLSLAASSSPRRPSQSWRRGIAAAAAVAVLVAGGVVIARNGPEQPNRDRERVATEPPAPVPDPVVLLPQGVDLATAPALFSGAGDAESVARAYLADRLGDRVAEIEDRLVRNLVLTPGPDIGAVRTFRWNQDDPGPEPKEHLPIGTVLLRDDAGTWGVVAAATDGLSLRSVEHDGSTVAGRAEVVRANVAVGSPTVDLTTLDGQPAPGVPLDPTDGGNVLHGNVIEGDGEFAVPVGSTPVVVTARSAGGRTLAITEVVLTPPPDTGGTTPTIVAPVDVRDHLGVERVWPGTADEGLPRSNPTEAATSFVRSLSGEDPEAVTVDEDANGAEGGGMPLVHVTMAGGHRLDVLLRRDDVDGQLSVLQAGPVDAIGGLSVGAGGPDVEGPGTSASGLRFPAPVGAVSGTVWYRSDRGSSTRSMSAAALDGCADDGADGLGCTIELGRSEQVQSVAVVLRDSRGIIVTLEAGSFA